MKPRPPLSTDQALARIAGQLPGGWPQMAEITCRSESLVRKWGDPECRERVPLDDAIELDLAFQEHGGEGAPLADSYLFRLELAAGARFASQFALLAKTEKLSKEAGEGLTAVIRACSPSATASDRAAAFRELVEMVEAAKPIISALDPESPAPSPVASEASMPAAVPTAEAQPP